MQLPLILKGLPLPILLTLGLSLVTSIKAQGSSPYGSGTIPDIPGGGGSSNSPYVPGGGGSSNTPHVPGGGGSSNTTPHVPGGDGSSNTPHVPGGGGSSNTPHVPGGLVRTCPLTSERLVEPMTYFTVVADPKCPNGIYLSLYMSSPFIFADLYS